MQLKHGEGQETIALRITDGFDYFITPASRA